MNAIKNPENANLVLLHLKELISNEIKLSAFIDKVF